MNKPLLGIIFALLMVIFCPAYCWAQLPVCPDQYQPVENYGVRVSGGHLCEYWPTWVGQTSYVATGTLIPTSPRYIATVKTGALTTDIQSCIIWVGLTSNSSATFYNASNPSTLNVAAFRYAPAVDSTAFWRVYTANGASSNVIATTTPIAYNTEYTLAIDCTGSSYVFYINGVVVATTNVDIPSSGNPTVSPFVYNYATTSTPIYIQVKNIWVDAV